MIQNKEAITNYEKNGYSIFQGFLKNSNSLSNLENTITELGKEFFGINFSLETPLTGENRNKLSDFYTSLRYSLDLQKLAVDSEVLDLIKSLGISHPIGMNQNNIRMDEPTRDDVLFHWHKDITYLLGSRNSITLWIPLGKTDLHHGTIGVKKLTQRKIYDFKFTNEQGMHKKNNLAPKDVVLANEIDTLDEVTLNTERGDIVAFSQYLLHRSRSNNSNSCRWTIQLRYSDLLEPGFIESGLPMGDREIITNVKYYGDFIHSYDTEASQTLKGQRF